ncbi:hypothetical protein TSAR_010467 [Trichomalopsis sarcophagae]|uniref:Uncharacterized protein n=1 Tax=Trichomalopsis sarcophagae TaxID=543379 RepID=A0A232EN18_9HYME|nr:hypothetical protein TSAR_010467 [Trichomalopsis sarcophagae]
MNIVQSFTAREKGLKSIQGYDIALLRLKCYHEDVYAGVAANPNAADYNPKPPVFACKFSSAPGYEQVIALANEDGKIALQDTSIAYDSRDPLEGTQAHNNAIFDIAWMPQELKLITASGERTACLWDVYSDIKELQVFHGHTHSVKSVVFRHQDKAVFATGARDGAIMIWDIRANHSQGQPRPDNSIFNAHELKVPHAIKHRKTPSQSSKSTTTQSVTALAFQDDYTLLSCSAGDGLIKAWDLRKNYTAHKKEPVAKHVMHYGGKRNTYNGFTSLLVDPAGITLYASCVDKKIYAYNISSYNPSPIAEYYGHGSDDKILSFFVKACLSPDGEYLASGSNDETAYIWRTRNPGTPIIKLSGHRDEVTCIAWCGVGESKIVTCSDDCYHRIWRVRPEPVSDEEKMNVFGCAERYEQPSNGVQTQSHNLQVMTPHTACTTTPNGESIRKSESRLSSANIVSSEKSESILLPILEKLVTSPRRSSLDNRAARKLHFSPSSSANNSKTPEPVNTSRPASKSAEETVADPCCIADSRKTPELLTPSKRTSKFTDQSLADCSYERVPALPFSPTTGLPNFVVDGTAPHLLANSPIKARDRMNWLTELHKRKSVERSGGRISQDSPSPKRIRKTPTRRASKIKNGDLRKTPRSSPCAVPAITNFYNNLSLSSSNRQSPCSS